MKTVVCVLIVLAFLIPVQQAGDILLCRGTMSSSIHYIKTQDVVAPEGTQKLVIELPTAPNATLTGYSLQTQSLRISYSTKPDAVAQTSEGISATWNDPPSRLRYTTDTNLQIDVQVSGLNSESQLPVKIPASSEGVRQYLSASKYVQSDDRQIKSTAKEITNGTRYESEAVTAIMLWVSDKLVYNSSVTSHDASWTLQNKRGNCENYAHLSLALLRSVGIPARYVSGYLVDGEIAVKGYVTTYGYRWDPGPHSWVEIYYPDIGWVPYEPQKTFGFVDDHHVREAVGLDSADVPNKLVYTYAASSAGRVAANVSLNATVEHDSSNLHVVHTSAASNKTIISQEMAHGGAVNDRIDVLPGEGLLIWLAVPAAVASAVIAGSAFLFARRRRR
jgi:transglutaminase-like putative cysteine protease